MHISKRLVDSGEGRTGSMEFAIISVIVYIRITRD